MSKAGEFLKYHGARAGAVLALPLTTTVGVTAERMSQGVPFGTAVTEGALAGGGAAVAETVGAGVDRWLKRSASRRNSG